MVKNIYWIQHTHKIKAETNNKNHEKVLYKLTNNAIYGKPMEYVRNRIVVKLVNNKKYFLKYTSKPSYMSHKIFVNNLLAIHKIRLVLKLNKPAYIGLCILELIKY